MRLFLLFMLFFTFIKADELYLTTYIYSTHFKERDSGDKKFNEKHNVYGLEYITDNQYSLTYNHFKNSRDKEVDVYGVGYLFEFNKSFGLHLIGGYQEGYCFKDFLYSVECQDDSDDTSVIVLPLLYYKNKYFKLDIFANTGMCALRLNIKIK